MGINQEIKKVNLKIHGMHCASCEVLIERKFGRIPGVEKVKVSHVSGKAELICKRQPELCELREAVKADGYSVSQWDKNSANRKDAEQRNTKRDYLEIGMIFFAVMAAYMILNSMNLLPKGLGVTGNMSYGFVFLIGLVAAVSSCIAVTGGLLLAIAARYNEQHPDLSGAQKFRPHIYFNLGRIVSYTVLGGALGAMGSFLRISPKATGFITIAASVVMILLGFQLLKLFPALRRFQPRMPKFLAHRIHEAGSGQSKTGPFALGSATFFLPCGFTQALQLYVLSRGSFSVGALTMLAFSLGTLPALLSLSAISSFAKGAFQKFFLKFSGVVVILIGLFSINNGLALTGSGFSFNALFKGNSVAQASSGELAKIVDGKQVVQMRVDGYNYTPSQFKVVQGVPVEWQVDGSAAAGCARVIVVPKLGITAYLPPDGIKTIEFTPQDTGKIAFSCSMGMTTRGAAFEVVSGTGDATGQTQQTSAVNASFLGDSNVQPSDPNAQKLYFSVTNAGFSPRSFTVKKGVPVEIIVDDQVALGGCMSVFLIPEYNVVQQIQVGENTLRFTPTEAGTLYITCSMGTKLVQIIVTD